MKSTATTSDATRPSSGDRAFSLELKEAAGGLWEQAVRHRFVKEVAADTIPDEVYARYLVQDHVFVDALVRLVARGVAAAPGIDAQRRLSGFLGVLTSEENDYFERSFDALGVEAEVRSNAVVSPVTHAFEDLFRAAVEEYSYAAVVTALLPVEWVYQEWAVWAKREGAGSRRFWLQEWVDLHATAEFGSFVDWLKREVDVQGVHLDAPARERLTARFVRAVELEGAFFSDAYSALG